MPESDLTPTCDALNAVSSIPWRINQPVLDIAIKLFNQGGKPSLDIPRPASDVPPAPAKTEDMDKKQQAEVGYMK